MTQRGQPETAKRTTSEPTSETGNGVFAVLLDMDGVILQGRGIDPIVHTRALEDVLEARESDIPDEHRETLSTYEYTDAFVDACAAVGVDSEELYTAREERSVARTTDRIAAGTRELYDDVDALDRIHDSAAIGLVSNNYHPAVEFVVDHFGLDMFEFVRGRDLGPEGFSHRKPEPHYLHEALDALGATDGLYVGDRESDLVAAERAGLESAFLRRDHNADAELGVEPTVELDGLEDLVAVVAGTETRVPDCLTTRAQGET